MFKFKGTVFILIVIHNLSFAGSIDPAVPGQISNDCTTKAWNLGATAFYLQPSFGGNGLGYTAYSNYGGNDNNGNFVGTSGAPNEMSNIYSKWWWSFQIEGSYHFRAHDLAVHWSHLNNNTRGPFPPNTLFSGNNDGFYAQQFQVRTNWDEVNIELGHSLYVNENKMLRPHAGIEFARIKNQFDNAPMLHPTSVIAYTTTDILSYNGFGPRLGVDFVYIIEHKHRFAFYAKTAGSLLVGTTKQQNEGYQTYPYPNNPPSPFVTANYSQSNPATLVPTFTTKLGVQYDWTFAQHNLSLDLGYLWINYLHSLVSYTGNGIVFANVGANSKANFNLNGVYCGINWGQ